MATRSGTRRGLLVAAGAAGLVAVFQTLPGLLGGSAFEFRPVEGMPGFRRLAAGEVSAAGFDPFVGIGERDEVPGALLEELRADPCAALFFGGRGGPERVPAAFFTDAYCPYCRVLHREIEEMRPGAGIALSVHDWPVFGAASVVAARAVLAARPQGGEAAMRARLMATGFRATPALVAGIAGDLGLSPERLARDMDGAAADAALARTRGLARLLALPGTPALVVGRTLVVGAIAPRRLAALIARERREGPAC